MIICSCNVLAKNQVTQVIQDGACCVSDVYRRLNVEPQCGRCAHMFAKIIKQECRKGVCARGLGEDCELEAAILEKLIELAPEQTESK